MDLWERELVASRIVSGTVRFRIGDDWYSLRNSSAEDRYIANQIYEESVKDGERNNLYSEEDVLDLLIDQRTWTLEEEELFLKLPKEIEEFKVKLFELTFKTNESKVIRKALGIAKERFQELAEKRGSHNHLTVHGNATLAKQRYLLSRSIYDHSGARIDPDSRLFDRATEAFYSSRLDESVLREVARTEPWRTTWSNKGHEQGLFGIPSAQYTDEQTSLVSWSGLYENIQSHPECPIEEVINDDDLLDGWMITQRRKTKKPAGINITNERIRNSQEIFIMAETPEDAKRVMELNDPSVMRTMKQRFNHLDKHGRTEEQNMPDTKKKIRQELIANFSKAMKGQG